MLRIASIFLFTISVSALQLMAQYGSESQDSLDLFYEQKDKITGTGMVVLGAWGLANMGSGIVGSLNSEGSAAYFHQMNAFWGGVNLFIAYTATRSLKKTANAPHALGYAELDQRKTERLFLINAGLDVLYIAGGYALLDLSAQQAENQERWQGYGQSLLVQGGFLLGFDIVMFCLHRGNKKKRLNPLMENVDFHGTGLTIDF